MIKKRTHRFGDFKSLRESIHEPSVEEFEEVSIDEIEAKESGESKEDSEDDIKIDDLDFGGDEEESKEEPKKSKEDSKEENQEDLNPETEAYKRKMNFVANIFSDYKKYLDKNGEMNGSMKEKIQKAFELLS